MTIGNRIKRVRRALDLTQTEFASRLGLTQNTVTRYETGDRNPSTAVLSLIIKAYDVNEEWLRNGEGEMFNPAPTDVLDRLAREYKLSNAAYIVVEKFVNLHPEKRNELINFFLDVSKAIIESSDPNAPAFPEGAYSGFSEDLAVQVFREMRDRQGIPKTPEELEKKFPPVDPGAEKSDAG